MQLPDIRPRQRPAGSRARRSTSSTRSQSVLDQRSTPVSNRFAADPLARRAASSSCTRSVAPMLRSGNLPGDLDLDSGSIPNSAPIDADDAVATHHVEVVLHRTVPCTPIGLTSIRWCCTCQVSLGREGNFFINDSAARNCFSAFRQLPLTLPSAKDNIFSAIVSDALAAADEGTLLSGECRMSCEWISSVDSGVSIADVSLSLKELNQPGASAPRILQMSVLSQPAEMRRLCRKLLASQVCAASESRQVWWRVAPASKIRNNPHAPVRASVQPLDVSADVLSRSVADEFAFLQPHQRMSVRWMAVRETTSDPFVADYHHIKLIPWEFKKPMADCAALPLEKGPFPLYLEYRVESAYDIRGGIMADKIGSGKTATCLAHVVQMATAHWSPAGSAWRQRCLLPLNATLVLCPDNVHHQWLDEAAKWPAFAASIRTVAIRSVDDLVRLTFKDPFGTKALLVVAPFSIFEASGYASSLSSPLTCQDPLTSQSWQGLVSRSLAGHRRTGSAGFALESYCWRRVIFDEFHELALAQGATARRALRLLQCDACWGLSGTPQELMVSTSSVERAARIFKCLLNSSRSAEQFCEQFVHASRVELKVSVEHRTVSVSLTTHEQAIYIQAMRDSGATFSEARPWDHRSLGILREVLQLCSHYSAAFDCSDSDLETARSLHAQKLKLVDQRLHEVQMDTCSAEGVAMGAEDRDAQPWNSQSNAQAKVLLAKCQGGKCGACLRCLDAITARRIKSRVELQQKHAAALMALNSFSFFDAILKLVCCSQVSQSCPICFDDFHPIDGVLLKCGHLFCKSCIAQVQALSRARQQKCPLCRDLFQHFDAFSVNSMLQSLDQQRAATLDTSCAKYGSKLASIVSTLQRIAVEEPGAKAILFCQWQCLEAKIAAALDEFGIQHLRLSSSRDLFDRRRVFEAFRDPENTEARVLLMSLDGHASGTNLTCATHVLLVHPMLAATIEQQVAYERQAIGRAVRLGQHKKVTVWHFVTRATIEEVVQGQHELSQ